MVFLESIVAAKFLDHSVSHPASHAKWSEISCMISQCGSDWESSIIAHKELGILHDNVRVFKKVSHGGLGKCFRWLNPKVTSWCHMFFEKFETVVRAEEFSCPDLFIEPLRSNFECLFPSIVGVLELHWRELLGSIERGTLRLHCDVRAHLPVFS